MNTAPPSFTTKFLRTLLLPQAMLTLVVGLVSILIFRADLWVEDRGIVYSGLGEIPSDNWLPSQCWKLSFWLASGEPWSYQLWNVLALWALTLCVYKLMRIWLEQSRRVSPELRPAVAVLAAVLCAVHPLAGMTACAVSNLGWQLATLFGMLSLLGANCLFRRPGYLPLLLGVACLGLAALASPSGFFLSAASIWVSWQLSCQEDRSATIDWFTNRQRWRSTAIFLAALQVMGIAWFVQSIWQRQDSATGLSWSAHLLTQGEIFWLQLRGLITPVELLPNHAVAWSERWTDWVSVSGLVLLAALLAVSLLALVKRPSDTRRPLYAILLLALWPSVLILGWRTADAFSEVRWYATLPWGAMLAAWVVGWIVTRWSALRYPLGLGIPVFLAFTCVNHLSRFQDSEQVIAMILAREPENMRMRCFAAELLSQEGNYTAVIKSSIPTEVAYKAILDYNATNPRGRRYDLVTALRWWVEIEQLVQLGIQKNYGLEYAQAYASNSTNKFSIEVRNIAVKQPEALPLLAQFPMPADPVEPAKPKPRNGIPGIDAATAQGEMKDKAP